MSPAKNPDFIGFFCCSTENIQIPPPFPLAMPSRFRIFTLQKPRSPGKQKSPGVKNPFRAFNTKA